jgi:DNA-binding XRE family transcriptional regulator
LKIIVKVNIIIHNNVEGVLRMPADSPLKALRERLMISRSELARKASLSIMTLERIENGKPCRLDTKRKIVRALGFNPWLKDKRGAEK